MSITIKTFADQNTPDDNNSKPFTLHFVPEHAKAEFYRDELGAAKMSLLTYGPHGGESHHDLEGNTYVMDGNKTIATFAHSEHFSRNEMNSAFENLAKAEDWTKIPDDLRTELAWAYLKFWNAKRGDKLRRRSVKLDRAAALTPEVCDIIMKVFEINGIKTSFEHEAGRPTFFTAVWCYISE